MSQKSLYSRNLHSYLSAENGSNSGYGELAPPTPTSQRRASRTSRVSAVAAEQRSLSSPSMTPSPSPTAPVTPMAPNLLPHQTSSVPPQLLSTSNWSLASSVDSTDRVSLSSSVNLNMAPNSGDQAPGEPTPPVESLRHRPDYDLLTRPAWIDAETGLHLIDTCQATGNTWSLYFRALVQARFTELGAFISANAGMVLFVGILLLVTFTAGLKSARIEANLDRLWIEDGGRLAAEMAYVKAALGDGAGSTNEILIQTPKETGSNLLYPNPLLLHLEAMKFASETSVDLFEANWKLKDICFRPATPQFEAHSIDSFLEKLIPCSIITPLDCFWEGSILLGPDVPVHLPFLAMPVEWTTLNPDHIMETMLEALKLYRKSELGKTTGRSETWEVEVFHKFMRQSGITSGYQRKPCLNPLNPACPPTAPNYNSSQSPDIGAELTGGCYGFATKYMHWPEDLIVGGVTRNRTGHIVAAKALQSIVQLMGEQDLFERYQKDYKVHNTDWNAEKAKMVLEAWQRAFTDGMRAFLADTDTPSASTQNLELFTSTSVADIMRRFSCLNYWQLFSGLLAMAAYVGYSLHKSGPKLERSQTVVGVLAVLLIELAIASALGLCALLGLAFNAITNLILPLLCLGLGLDNMFVIAKVYSSDYLVKNVPFESRTSETLKQVSSNLLLTILTTIGCFLASTLIPMPVLRVAALQAAILHSFISFAVIILFPALASLQLRFRALYLTSTPFSSDRFGGAGSPNGPSSTLLNAVFLLCCCGVPKRLQNGAKSGSSGASRSSSSNSLLKSSQSSVGAMGGANCPAGAPYIQPYNYYYLNSIQQRADAPVTGPQEAKKQSRRSSLPKSGSLDSGIDQIELAECGICRCNEGNGYSTSSLEKTNEEHYRLMRKCGNCGGDLRPACEGQDEERDYEEDVEGKEDSVAVVVPVEAHQKVSKKPKRSPKEPFKCSLQYFLRVYYIPLLSRKPVKVLVLLGFLITLSVSLYGASLLEDGLDLTDIVPRNTTEHRFLHAQREHFSFFYMYAVTMGNFDYPNNQKLLHEYHHAFTRIPAIIKNDDGGPPPFWLSMFRDWLLGLQAAFDRDWAAGAINAEGWKKVNASDEAILAFKLLVQTGRVDNPIDKTLLSTVRLVSEEGIINPKPFYNYLTAWVHTDVMAYSASEGNFQPDPLNRRFFHDAHDTELKIPKAQPLTYAQMPFYLTNIRTTSEITQTIENVRAICRKYEDRSLPNFPTGNPFTYWEQYVRLRFWIAAGVLVALSLVFLSLAFLLFSPWSALLILLVLVSTLLEVIGFMGLAGILLSAIPGVILIISIGIGTSLLTHILISFITAIGDRNRRMAMSLEHMFTPVKNSLVSTLIGIVILAFCQFDFVFEYFFLILLAVLAFGTLNAFILLPVLLSLFGPTADLIPLEFEDRIGTPSPPASPMLDSRAYENGAYGNVNTVGVSFSAAAGGGAFIHPRASSGASGSGGKAKKTPMLLRFGRSRSRRHGLPARVQSEISLSTISEEPNSYVSSVQPTPTPNPPGGRGSVASFCAAAQQAQAQAQQQQQQAQVPPHEIVVQPEFVVETTITNNGSHRSGSSGSGSSESIPTSSPSPTSSSTDQDSLSGRDSAASTATGGAPGGCSSRSGSAASFTTTTTTTALNNGSNNETLNPSSSSTTVTTKVMATTKLTIPMAHPALHPQMAPPQLFQLPYGTGANPGAAVFFAAHPQGGYYPTSAPAPAPNAHQHHHHHTHMTPEPCRSCPGCRAAPPTVPGMAMPVHLSQHHPHHPQQHPQQPTGNLASHSRSGAWNHGMIGPYSNPASSGRRNSWR